MQLILSWMPSWCRMLSALAVPLVQVRVKACTTRDIKNAQTYMLGGHLGYNAQFLMRLCLTPRPSLPASFIRSGRLANPYLLAWSSFVPQHIVYTQQSRTHCCRAAAAMTGNAEKQRSGTHVQAEGDTGLSVAESCLRFINSAWTQYHAVEEASKRLAAVGFEKLSEKQAWSLRPGGRYYFTRNLSTIVAFAVGSKYEPGNGFHMIGAHTDSPCLKLKPVSKSIKSDFLMVNVEPYGGGLWHTWFDRDLSVAGRVLVRKDGQLQHKLVKIEEPIMRIPMLAIHLNRDIGTEGFKPNKQTHCVPVLATAIKKSMAGPAGKAGLTSYSESSPAGNGDAAAEQDQSATTQAQADKSPAAGQQKEGRHHSVLMKRLAQEVGCQPEDIVDFELNVCDTQPGVIGGINKEFLFVGRLDNLCSSWCALAALLDSYPTEAELADESCIKAVALFDHEEVGSASAQGAGGPVMRDAILRASLALSKGQAGVETLAIQRSFLVSADMSHAVHPNYADKHDPQHQPQFHCGLVLKHNVNQRYATNAVTATLFKELARRRGIPTQEFCVKSDMACGSTIGPILSSGLGCRTVDVGGPQLSMHSIREMCGTKDVAHAYNHFRAFFEDFTELDATTDFDSLEPPQIEGTIIDTPCHQHK